MTQFPQSFPNTRMRRLRQSPWVRSLVAENTLTPADLVWAVFIHDGEGRTPVGSLPGIDRLSVEEAAKTAKRAESLGIPAIALFPYIGPEGKDEEGTGALDPDGLVPRALRAMKDAAPGVGLITDVALDAYTSHGHDGLLDSDGTIPNDATVERLVKQALAHAQAGADIVAPSDMMDGRIGAIREAFDEEGFTNMMILSYAAKYASGFYGPYRDAIGSAQALSGDKKTYQQDPANSEEALREVALDLAEGADMVMVKPGLPYLDIVQRVSSTFGVPTLAYQVSGEYAQIMAAAQNGWIDGDRVIMESLMCFKRAGASGIITYFAEKAAETLGG
ncbi:porphobilinogen synthase [uncultured Hyphomonas sp.]|uniref:porphobilinogen synthase n=1 Tax=uncultured Hyphomonas sp. TaxID=225298 RepID=UPI002AAABEE9|nr:porphobilinogen synthase [uncultured Hyphomonas sp.]